jgi:hypothetical protein
MIVITICKLIFSLKELKYKQKSLCNLCAFPT